MPNPNLSKLIFKNLVAGFGYFAGGWLGTFLVVPPSNASPIWPAAGIALTALLVCGEAVIPGIFLGALAAQFYSFLDTSSFANMLESFGVAGVASIGSCLQAWVGMLLINRWVGKQNALIADRKILYFFALIAVSCLISASIGVGSLFLRGVIGPVDLIGSWTIWWAGDTIGAAIMTPMLLLFFGQPRAVWQARQRFVLYPLLLVLFAVLLVFEFNQRQEATRIENVFERQVELLHTQIIRHLHAHFTAVETVKALFNSSEHVAQEEFIRFAQSIYKQDTGILEWTPRISNDERESWQAVNANVIRQLSSDNTLQPAPVKAEYFPITFIEPLAGNEAVLGFDISSNPRVSPIINQAIDSGETLATGTINLVQYSEPHAGLVIYAPVYRKGFAIDSPEQRRQHFLGFAAYAFRVDMDIEQIFAEIGPSQIQLFLEVFDNDLPVYSNVSRNSGQGLQFHNFSKAISIDFAGRHWQLHYQTSSEFFYQQQSRASWWLLLGGFLLCSLTGFGLLLLTGRTARVEDLVTQRTLDLLRSNQALNQEIAIRRQQEHELRIAAATFESHEAVLVTDANSIILRVNQAFTRITGFRADEVIGKTPKLLASGAHDQQFYQQMYAELAEKNEWKGEIWNRRKNGEVFPELLTITGVRDEQKQLTQYVAIFSDISAQKSAEQEIHSLAFYDPLTNLPNRRLMLDRLQQEIAAAKRQTSYGALFFLDLDHFKHLNDSRGHHVGDELLIQVANRLKSIIRDEDTACRLGGDEFVIMVPGRLLSLQQATDHAAILAEKILLTISQPYLVEDSELHFSTSIGVTLYPNSEVQPEDIIQQADTAMYRAKESGRNSISFYESGMQAAADKRLTMEKELRFAIKEGQFLLHYQPQVDDQGRVMSAEALIRWAHPEKGMISPAEFIPLAEDTQLILPLGNWVLQEACRQIKAWDKQGSSIGHVAVNVSSRQFRQIGFVQQVRQALLDEGVHAHRLVVELTEGSVIEDIEDTIAKMRALQAMGVRISIDDFGMGYSSLSYLKSLPLSQLKIDQSFVKQIDDPNSAVIVETIIMMAKSLGLNVIAEGVEQLDQVDFLRNKGCLSYQGYYFSRPLTADAFCLHLEANQA